MSRLAIILLIKASNESDDSLDSTGNVDGGKDPDFGVAGSKKFDAWSTWDEE